MNRIVREHYPVANLPEDLREGLVTGAKVRVVIEMEDQPKSLTLEENLELFRRYREANPERVSTEEAVARIRQLRDEWDD